MWRNRSGFSQLSAGNTQEIRVRSKLWANPIAGGGAISQEFPRKVVRWNLLRCWPAWPGDRLASSGCISLNAELLFLFAGVFVVLFGRHEICRLVLIEDANSNHPSISVRIAVDLFR